MKPKTKRKRVDPGPSPGNRICYYVPLDSLVDGEGYRASVVKEGEGGHYPTGSNPYTGAPEETRPLFWGPTYDDAMAQAMRLNARMGLTKKDVDEIVNSSMINQPAVTGRARWYPAVKKRRRS